MDIDEKEKTIQKNDIIECPKCSLNINDSCNNETKQIKQKILKNYFVKIVQLNFVLFYVYFAKKIYI